MKWPVKAVLERVTYLTNLIPKETREMDGLISFQHQEISWHLFGLDLWKAHGELLFPPCSGGGGCYYTRDSILVAFHEEHIAPLHENTTNLYL